MPGHHAGNRRRRRCTRPAGRLVAGEPPPHVHAVLTDLALPLTAAGSSVAWAQLAARRAGHGAGFATRALLAGTAAFGLALCGYEALARAGLEIRWEQLVRGGPASLAAAAAIGLVEEGAKLAGLLLFVEGTLRPRALAAAAAGVAAGFAALEALLVLGGAPPATALARAALAPLAHALLAAPLVVGLVVASRTPRARGPALVAALLASAALHGAGDLSLANRAIGSLGYAAALGAPALVLFAWSRKRKGPLGWRTLRTHRGRPLLGLPAGGRFRV